MISSFMNASSSLSSSSAVFGFGGAARLAGRAPGAPPRGAFVRTGPMPPCLSFMGKREYIGQPGVRLTKVQPAVTSLHACSGGRGVVASQCG